MDKEIDKGKTPILVVDDDLFLLAALKQTLRLDGYQVEGCDNPVDALQKIEKNSFAALLTDIRMPEMDGLTLLEQVKNLDVDLPVILITGHGDVALAVKAMKKGAYHFLQKPVDEELLLTTLASAIERRTLILENQRLERELFVSRGEGPHFHNLLGKHPLMLDVYAAIENFAKKRDPVLIMGDTGTGKELVAKALHSKGENPTAPYVAVNMGAIPADIIESELFGYEKGAFTGAVQRKIGKFEFVGKGTLFLDEICSMSPALQSRLLRVLEERKFYPLGSNLLVKLEAKIVAATNLSLEEEVAKGNFRHDLFYRLNVLPIALPCLKERREDIPLLVAHFCTEYAETHNETPTFPSATLLEDFCSQEWPGNVRELRNAVRRFCISGEHQTQATSRNTKTNSLSEVESTLSWKEYMDQQEEGYLRVVLKKCRGQVTTASATMGLSRKSVYEKIKKHGISLEEIRLKEDGKLEQ